MTQQRNTRKPVKNYLREYLTALGLTLEKAGEAVGLPPTGIWRPASGERKLQFELALPLWKSFGFPAEDAGYLYTKRPDPEYFARHGVEWKGPSPSSTVVPLPGLAFRRVEVIGAVQAGVFTEAMEWDYDRRYFVSFPENDGYDPDLPRYGLEVKGESMNKTFPAGSVVCVINFYDLNRPPETGDYVVIQRRATCVPGAEATVKALQIMDDGSWRLWPQSTEPEFQQPLIIPPNNSDSQDTAEAPEIEVKGLVVGLLKTKLKASF